MARQPASGAQVLCARGDHAGLARPRAGLDADETFAILGCRSLLRVERERRRRRRLWWSCCRRGTSRWAATHADRCGVASRGGGASGGDRRRRTRRRRRIFRSGSLHKGGDAALLERLGAALLGLGGLHGDLTLPGGNPATGVHATRRRALLPQRAACRVRCGARRRRRGDSLARSAPRSIKSSTGARSLGPGHARTTEQSTRHTHTPSTLWALVGMLESCACRCAHNRKEQESVTGSWSGRGWNRAR